MSIDLAKCYEFGRFRLYGPSRLLVGPPGRFRLTEITLRVLVCLMEHAREHSGQIVTKEDLLAAVWNGEVEESNLSSQVSTIRRYLGESARTPVLIETVSRVGYLFRARVREIGYEPQPEEETGGTQVSPEAEPVDRSQHRVRLPPEARGLERLGFFQEFTEAFDRLLDGAAAVTTFYIHSRRWRENHHHKIVAFLGNRQHTLIVFLPEPSDRVLRGTFLRNFDDGPQIPAFIDDACRYFARLARDHPGQVDLRFVRNYPTYSFYIFDGHAVLAMYPTTRVRRPVPTLQVALNSELGAFVQTDVDRLLQESRVPGATELRRLAANAPRRRRTARKTQ